MADLDEVREGLQLFERQAWASAYAALAGADERAPLACDQLEVLATAAYLAGLDGASDQAWTRAFHIHQRADDPQRAVRCAFWLAFRLLNAGDVPQGSGWVARIRRLLERCPDSAEQGYGSYVYALQSIFGGDASGAEQKFAAAAELGARFGDADLVTMARVGQGCSLIYLGEAEPGLALLDEAMVAVAAGEVSPVIVGDTYCSVIEACSELFDLRRVQAWTSELGAWCDAQPELVAFRGQCMVHRAEALQLRGEWPAALAEARRACAQLSTPLVRPAAGAAHYQEGELHRLRGEFAAAEAAYRRASAAGRDPQPGLALLRLAEGNTGCGGHIHPARAERDGRRHTACAAASCPRRDQPGCRRRPQRPRSCRGTGRHRRSVAGPAPARTGGHGPGPRSARPRRGAIGPQPATNGRELVGRAGRTI